MVAITWKTIMPASDSGSALVLEFAAIDRDAIAAVGGKAANLGVLTRAGLPVPPGVCVTTEAYRQVAEGVALTALLEAIAAMPATDTDQLALLAGRMRKALLAAPVPDAVADPVIAGYRTLGPDAAVAVRSSATAEDLPFASFAGQQDTYLNIIGTDAVLEAVRRCWASLWTDRAVAYRATQRIDPHTVRLAVVIQKMVDAAVAGVLFTANSVTGRRRQAVIDASPGLGEAVVSGAVNPDHFVVNTDSGEIVERRIGDKRVVIRARRDGGTERIEGRSRSEACVSDAQVRALADLGARVEAHYGSPQDTEWAIDADGALWLTQARPITTLFPVPANAPSASGDLRVYFCFTVAQGLYRPITPMGLAAFRVLASSASELLGFPVADPRSGPKRYAEAGQRVFADLTGVLRSRAGRALMPRALDVMEARSAVILRQLSEDPRLSLTNSSLTSAVRRVVRIAFRYKVPIVALRAVATPDAAHRAATAIGTELDRRLAALGEHATADERLTFVEQMLMTDFISLVPRIMPAAAAGFAMFMLASKVLGDDAEADELQTVMRSLPHNITTEMDLALWEVAEQIRSDDAAAAAIRGGSAAALAEWYHGRSLPPVAQQVLDRFLARYGHRAVADIDLGLQRWSEDPRHILGVIKNYLQVEDAEQAPAAVFARGAAAADAMIETLASRARRRGGWRARLVRFALRRARVLVGLRELPKYYLIVALGALRRQIAIVGAELAAAGRLADTADVFFVDLDEARAGLRGKDLRAIVTERRAAYALELGRRHVPRVLLSDGTEPETQLKTTAAPDGSLSGTPASAGVVTGVARVILDPVGAHLEPGEILVAPSTDPGWTPLFLIAGGLVMEMGGANSHGAVVAREYGIPAVVGVPDATLHITTGQRIAVDGSSGTVTVI
jgi:phosphohistidine swiveling domain-containing protein